MISPMEAGFLLIALVGIYATAIGKERSATVREYFRQWKRCTPVRWSRRTLKRWV
ncbi:MAG: hypothetical protein J0L53_18800 [Spirochaetes bacterium]|nr:hypothetical protein [Spirochaetota bacterium]